MQVQLIYGELENLEESFLHVDDLAKAIIVCLDKYDSDQQINIGTGIDLTVEELAEKIAKNTGFHRQY
jgi:GDP-L-fucose synthase